jgi:adenylate kinase family enzyme
MLWREKMNRIWIFGGTASGKTTLATKIAKKLKLRHYTTDFMKYNKDFTKKFPEGTKERKIKELAKKKRWICEGTNNGEWVWPAFKKSDFVIVLKPSSFIRARRLFNREINERNRKLGIKKSLHLLYVVFAYNFRGYMHHKNLIKRFNKKFTVLRNDRQINKFLEELK